MRVFFIGALSLFILTCSRTEAYLSYLKGIGSSLFADIAIKDHDPIDTLTIAYFNFTEFMYFIDQWSAPSWQYVARHGRLQNTIKPSDSNHNPRHLRDAVSPKTPLPVSQVKSMHSMAILKTIYFGDACLALNLSISQRNISKLLQVHSHMSHKYYFERCMKQLFNQTTFSLLPGDYLDPMIQLDEDEPPFLSWITGSMFATMSPIQQIKLLAAPRARVRLDRDLVGYLSPTQLHGLIDHVERGRLDTSDYLECFDVWFKRPASWVYPAWELEIRAQQAELAFPRLLASFKNFSMSQAEVCAAVQSDPVHVLTMVRRYNAAHVSHCVLHSLSDHEEYPILQDCFSVNDEKLKFTSKDVPYMGASKCGVAMCRALLAGEYFNFESFEHIRRTNGLVIDEVEGLFTDPVCLNNVSVWKNVTSWRPPHFQMRTLARYMSATIFNVLPRSVQQQYLSTQDIRADDAAEDPFLSLVPASDWSALLVPSIDDGVFVQASRFWTGLKVRAFHFLPLMHQQLQDMPRLRHLFLTMLKGCSVKELRYIRETDLANYYRFYPYFEEENWMAAYDKWCRSSNVTMRNEGQRSGLFLERDYRYTDMTLWQKQANDCALLAPHQIHPTFLPKGFNEIPFTNLSRMLKTLKPAKVHELSFVQFMAERTWFPYLPDDYFRGANETEHIDLTALILRTSFMELRPVHQVQFLTSMNEEVLLILDDLKGLMVNEAEFRAFFERMKRDLVLAELDLVPQSTWRRLLAPPKSTVTLAPGRQPQSQVGHSVRSFVCQDYASELPRTCEAFHQMFPLESKTKSSGDDALRPAYTAALAFTCSLLFSILL